MNGYSYDAAGNVLNDGLNSGCGSNSFTWNAEGQMSCGAGTTYTYDGDGARVKKSGGTLYWGPGPLAESDLSGNITSEYISFGGIRIARRDISGGSVYYYLSDHLGSSNVVTNATGAIQNESDYYPFGGESVVSQNLATQNYKFTGKERDTESGNDYFGARYYGSSMGRFMSPDWSAKREPIPYAKLANPQSLNLYAYMNNNPLVGSDPDGHSAATEADSTACAGANSSGNYCSSNQPNLGADQDSTLMAGQQQQAQQQNAVQTAGQKAASGPYGSNVISVSGNTTTLPLYNGPNSSAEIIGTQVVTDNLNSNGSGTIKIVNTNQSIEGSPTETITMRLKSGLTQGISVRSSDGSVNMDSSTSFNSHTGQATVTMVNHNTNTVNVRVYDTAGGSGPVLRSNTTYDTTWVH